MFAFTPKLHHAVLAFLASIAAVALVAGELTALIVGAVGFAIISAVVIWLLILQAYDDRTEKIIQLARLYKDMDDEARQALAFQFPRMQYHMKHGIVRGYFENTNVPIETFRLFLQTSNDRYISPERDWHTAEMPLWAHTEIRLWLESHGRIIPDSAAGSHSWLWNGNSYSYLMAYWMAGRNVENLAGSETVFEG